MLVAVDLVSVLEMGVDEGEGEGGEGVDAVVALTLRGVKEEGGLVTLGELGAGMVLYANLGAAVLLLFE